MSTTLLSSVMSHWDQLHEGLEESPQAFYDALEASLAKRAIPNSKISRVEHKEAGMLSTKRLYLRIEREHLCFDVCAAPFGPGFFTSWWLAEADLSMNIAFKMVALFGMGMALAIANALLTLFGPILVIVGGILALISVAETGGDTERFVLSLPIVGAFYRRFIKPPTYYQLDSELMFQNAVHNAVLEVVDAMLKTKGLRALTSEERKPIMRDFFKRQ